MHLFKICVYFHSQLSQLDVPVSAEVVARYKEREEQEKLEKERMKRMVLDIHDRQEEEEYQGGGQELFFFTIHLFYIV